MITLRTMQCACRGVTDLTEDKHGELFVAIVVGVSAAMFALLAKEILL